METTDNDGSIEEVANSLLLMPQNPESDTPKESDDEVQDEIEEAQDESSEEEESDISSEEDSEGDVAEEQDDEGQVDPDTFTVKVDGEEVQVSIDDLKRSYSGQAYIQKGMQEAAAQKKQAESIYQALLNERQQLSQLLAQAQSGDMLREPVPPTKDLFNKDPIGYMEAKMQYDEAKAAFDQQKASIQQVQEQQSQQMEYARQVYLKEEMQKLTAAIPEFAVPEKAAKIKDSLIKSGMRLGYSEAELVDVSDHRALVTLYKAMKYDEIVNGKAKAEQKSSKARKMVKPGAKQQASSENVKAREKVVARMKQTGDINDVAAFILS